MTDLRDKLAKQSPVRESVDDILKRYLLSGFIDPIKNRGVEMSEDYIYTVLNKLNNDKNSDKPLYQKISLEVYYTNFIKDYVFELNNHNIYEFYLSGGLSTYLKCLSLGIAYFSEIKNDKNKLEKSLDKNMYTDVDIYVSGNLFNKLLKDGFFSQDKENILSFYFKDGKKCQIMNLMNFSINSIVDEFDINLCRNYIQFSPYEGISYFARTDSFDNSKSGWFSSFHLRKDSLARLEKYMKRYPKITWVLNENSFSEFKKHYKSIYDEIESSNIDNKIKEGVELLNKCKELPKVSKLKRFARIDL